MKTFKAFITENYKDGLINDPLDLHMKYHAAGIPLPDRNDLYQRYKDGPVGYPKENEGTVLHSLAGNSVAHFNEAGNHHREDGPAVVDNTGATWSKDGHALAHHVVYNYDSDEGPRKIILRSARYRDEWKENLDKGDFNYALSLHGFPPHKED